MAEEVPNLIEELDEGRWIGAGGATDRRLIDRDDFIDFREAVDLFVRTDGELSVVQVVGKERVKGIGDERGLSRSRDACDGCEDFEGDVDGDLFEVVVGGFFDRELSGRFSPFRDGDLYPPREISSRERF